MTRPAGAVSNLLDVDDCVLVLVDVQAAFLDRLPDDEAEAIVRRACWVSEVAIALDVPVVVTAEALPDQPLHPAIVGVLPAGHPVHDKRVFGLAGQDEVLEAVASHGRGTVVLLGLETDVCVCQSALGLVAEGKHVAVLTDVTGTPGYGHDAGLARMDAAGVALMTAKMLFYEWLRTLDGVQGFLDRHPHLRDDAVVTL